MKGEHVLTVDNKGGDRIVITWLNLNFVFHGDKLTISDRSCMPDLAPHIAFEGGQLDLLHLVTDQEWWGLIQNEG